MVRVPYNWIFFAMEWLGRVHKPERQIYSNQKVIFEKSVF